MPATTSKLTPRLIVVVTAILLLVLLIHLAGVAALRYFVERELHPALPKGTYVGDVHLNLFAGRLRVVDFQLRDAGGVRMRFGELDVEVSPWRLLSGTVQVNRVSLQRAYARVDRREDGSFDLGLPSFGDGEVTADDGPALDLRIAGIDLERVTVEYHDGELASVLYADRVQVGAYSLRARHQQVPVDWTLQWDGRPISGRAQLTLSTAGVAAEGRLETGLLDIGRAQRLARLDPAVLGEFSYQGPFRWEVPKLTLAGAIASPALSYRADGQQARVDGLSVPGFELVVLNEPVLNATLDLAQAASLESIAWQAVGQGADLEGARLQGRIHYSDGDAVVAESLAVGARRVAWEDGERRADVDDLRLSGALRQALAADAGLPTVAAQLGAARLSYRDAVQAVSVQVVDIEVDRLDLKPGKEASVRVIDTGVRAGAGTLERATSQVDWQGVNTRFAGRIWDTPAFSGDVDVSALRVSDPALPSGPLTLGKVSAMGLGLGGQTRFKLLRLAGIDLPAEPANTALKVAAVELRDGRFDPADGVALGEIVIDGLQTGIVRNKAGEWRHSMSGAGQTPEAEPQPAAETSPEAPGEAPAWQVGAVRVTGDSWIRAADHLNPDMQAPTFHIEQLDIGALDSRAPASNTPFTIVLRPDEYSEFRFAGEVRPLAQPLYLKADGHLHGFGLNMVNGLVANDLGHRFLTGQLDNDFSISIDKEHLEMANKLGIAEVTVEEIPGKDGPPLGTAIALLEDRDGNIKLEVPVSGDLNDPDFRVLGALNPIIMKAVAGTAALAIQPLGSVLLVGGLLANQALKVTFEPAVFDPGSADLNPAAKDYLGKLGAKLAEKPKLAVRICGLVVDAERKRDKKGAYLDREPDLLAMAQARADLVRAELRRAGAGPKQLRVCRPAVDPDPAAKPRVDVRF